MKKIYGLAIETSCDDTSIALLEDNKVIECVTKNNNEDFKNYGGIVPEIASRNHAKNVTDIFEKLYNKHEQHFLHLNYIAYTNEPGLQISLHVGEILARSLSFQFKVPIFPINHIYGHIYSSFINKQPLLEPFLALVASGKTTSLFLVNSPIDIVELVATKDDAIGEVYDKIGLALGMSYPGGPKIDAIFDSKIANIKFSFSQQKNIFSYSGLKSQVLNYIKNNPNVPKQNIASSFQKTIIDNLIKKIIYYKKKFHVNYLVIGGGVAANNYLREQITLFFDKFFIPLKEFSCDNAAMIGYYCYIKEFKKN